MVQYASTRKEYSLKLLESVVSTNILSDKRRAIQDSKRISVLARKCRRYHWMYVIRRNSVNV